MKPDKIPDKKPELRPEDLDVLLKTCDEVAKHPAVRVSRWTVTAVKITSEGQPDAPFSGRYTTARRFNDWLLAHPDFVASHVMRKHNAAGAKKRKCPPQFRKKSANAVTA